MNVRDAIAGLLDGDFSRLEPLFVSEEGAPPQIVQWVDAGLFDDEPQALAEALSCASFLGHLDVVEHLLDRGVDPASGTATGLDALHWAANRGQLEAVRLPLRRGAPLETRNRFDGTVLGLAVWSSVHEPRADHLQIIEELLRAGARVEEVVESSGREDVDALLRRYRRPDVY